MKLWKYSGAGNDFIVADGRERHACALCQALTLADIAERDSLCSSVRIREICSRTGGFVAADGRIGADGLIILRDSGKYDFRMEFYNPDGSKGMMCGNGGRCITAFADRLGIKPAGDGYVFEAADGIHTASVLSREGSRTMVRLGMVDATGLRPAQGGYFLDTGTRHLVVFVADVDEVDVAHEGARLRWMDDFAPEGTNVNFVSACGGGLLKVRTFEKGVEAETLSCGTGVTAASIAAYYHGVEPLKSEDMSVMSIAIHYDIQARGGRLAVDFLPAFTTAAASNVFLTGPADCIL